MGKYILSKNVNKIKIVLYYKIKKKNRINKTNNVRMYLCLNSFEYHYICLYNVNNTYDVYIVFFEKSFILNTVINKLMDFFFISNQITNLNIKQYQHTQTFGKF